MVFLIITITSITVPQYSCIAYMVSFLVLFSDFYYKVRSYKMLKVNTVCLSCPTAHSNSVLTFANNICIGMHATVFKQFKAVRIV